MRKTRREFLKISSLAGMGLSGIGLHGFASEPLEKKLNQMSKHFARALTQRFNMCGYAAPKLDTVRVGFIGLGQRGPTHLVHASKLDGVEIKALCDIRPEKVNAAKKMIKNTANSPSIYTGKEDAWKQLCERQDIDLVYIATPWDLHVPMAVYAMQHGKHVAIEVPAATTLEECWLLVKTSESTRKHCTMLENCCYDFFELLTLNMARQGLFGEIIHGEGAYIHDLIEHNFSQEQYYDMWRLKENIKRNGNLYPTHGLGPICQIMNINRGDKMEYLTSVSSNDFIMGKTVKELAAKDDFFKTYINKTYRGNMNTTIIRTDKGRTIMLQHDVSSPRVYSRIHMISGTKGGAQKYPVPGRISIGHEDWVSEKQLKSFEEKYNPPIIKKVGEMAKQVGGHGGMDFLMNWRLIDCLRNGLPLDQDVYDAALWSSIAPLSEWSVANRSNSIDVPDFTSGSWKNNPPVDILLEKGGTTKVKI